MADGPDLTLELKCTVPVPRARVWKACTEPEELARWWGPTGFTSPGMDFEPEVGRSYRIAMQPPDGDLFYLQGEFTEVDPPNRLAYTFRWEDPDPDDRETVATLTFRDLGDSTELALSQGPFLTEARRELHEGGWSDGFRRLEESLSQSSD